MSVWHSRWLAVVGLSLLAACGGHDEESAAPPAQPAQQQAMPVQVVVLQPQTVSSVEEFSGRARAFEEAEIRPQVSGLIQKRLFTEGQTVSQGDPLYKIDDSEYVAAVESASAALERAEAVAEVRKETAERYARLSEINAISRQSYDEAASAARQAEADIEIQRAALKRARIDLERTTIRSPIAGRIGRSTVTPGALVTQNQTTALARVVQLDPIYVDITVPASRVVDFRRQAQAAGVKPGEDVGIPVTLSMEDGFRYPQEGQLQFGEVSVDEAAGTVVLRAKVPNPDALLLPGMFLRASFPARQYDNAILIPQAAATFSPRGEPVALVAGETGVVEQRMLEIAGQSGNSWIVTSGLSAGDKLIVSNLQIVSPGMPVTPVPAKGEDAQAAASAPGRQD